MDNEETKPSVAIIMGSQSDWETMKFSKEILIKLNIPFITKIISAHRTPDRMNHFAKKAKENTWEVYTHGGREPTQLNALEFAKLAQENGAGEILLTSMDRDGTKEGYDIELTKKISSSLNIPVIASGGVGNLEHLKDGIIKGGSSAVLAASIFHFGEYSIQEAKEYLKKENVPVRL